MTDKLRAAAEAAIEVLETAPYLSNKDDHEKLYQTIDALYAALGKHSSVIKITDDMMIAALKQQYGGSNWNEALYKQMRQTLRSALCHVEPVQREWVSLTNKEIQDIHRRFAGRVAQWEDVINTTAEALRKKNT